MDTNNGDRQRRKLQPKTRTRKQRMGSPNKEDNINESEQDAWSETRLRDVSG